jgi:hypothetical protein
MKRELTPKNLEGVHVETRTTSSINFASHVKQMKGACQE